MLPCVAAISILQKKKKKEKRKKEITFLLMSDCLTCVYSVSLQTEKRDAIFFQFDSIGLLCVRFILNKHHTYTPLLRTVDLNETTGLLRTETSLRQTKSLRGIKHPRYLLEEKKKKVRGLGWGWG